MVDDDLDDGGDLPDDCPICQLTASEQFLNWIDGWFDYHDTRNLALAIDLESAWLQDSVILTLYDQYGYKSTVTITNELLADQASGPFAITVAEKVMDGLGWALAKYRDDHTGMKCADDILGPHIGSNFHLSWVQGYHGDY